LRQTVCSTFSRSGWSAVRSVSLSKGGISEKRPSPHLQKVPTRSNNVRSRTFQTALVYKANGGDACMVNMHWKYLWKKVLSDFSRQN
jgi:hypothetical protein